MAESSAPCTCPQGHDDTVKLLSTVSVGGLASVVPSVLLAVLPVAEAAAAGPAAAGSFSDTEEATGSIPVPPTKFYQVS